MNEYNLKAVINEDLPKQVNDFLNYLQNMKANSKNTILGYQCDLTLFFRFMKIQNGIVNIKNIHNDKDFANIKINDIDDKLIKKIKYSDLNAFTNFLEFSRKNCSSSRARKVATLKSFFKYLTRKAKILKENPSEELESPKISKRNPIYLTLDKSKTLLNTTNISESKFNKRDFCIITLLLNCGMRVDELCKIDISKIKEDTLYILGKGAKERTVYLNDACLKAISKYMDERNKMKNQLKNEDAEEALFVNRNKLRVTTKTVERIVDKYTKKANLIDDRYTPHKLRHSFATNQYKYAKTDIRILSKILGHESVATTQIYTHVDDEQLREATKLNPLNSIF